MKTNIIITSLLTLLVVTQVHAADPHFSETSASYVASDAPCSNCHISPDANNTLIRKSWALTGHANANSSAWNAYDFKRQNACVQCHTTTGFIAYSSGKLTSAWGDALDKTKEVLACNGCHADIASGSLRAPVTIRPYTGDSYRNLDVGPSNLCVGCHSGTMSGRGIKGLSDFNSNFIGSHFLAASGILNKSIGYEFNGPDYRNKPHFKHDRIGINNYSGYGYSTGNQGPCIACHMSSPDKHSYLPVTKAVNGTVTAVTNSLCAGCHTAPAFLDAERLNKRKLRFTTSLLALQRVLESKGIYYNASTQPFFFTDSAFTTPYTAWGGADKMGAAFNLHLLMNEPGAYAHNMVYAKRLIFDSIDYSDDAVLNKSVSTAINALTTLDNTQKTAAIAYLTPSGARP